MEDDNVFILGLAIFVITFLLTIMMCNVGRAVTIDKSVLDNICKEKFGNDTISYTPNILFIETSIKCKRINVPLQYDHQEIYLVGEE